MAPDSKIAIGRPPGPWRSTIAGTDMCIKIGGWVQAQYEYGANGSTTHGGFDGNVNDRSTSNSVWRMRGYITADARNQTAYGTVRAYMDVG
jgi:Porin subfamily